MPFEKIKVWIVHCRTGCTCCASENHYRGPFKTKEKAEEMAKSYHDLPLLASQFARRGLYRVGEWTAEVLPDGRLIVDDTVILGFAEDTGDEVIVDF